MVKKKKVQRKATKLPPELSQDQPGMPALNNIEEVTDFVSPQGDKYKILKTTETDAYDLPLEKQEKRRPKK